MKRGAMLKLALASVVCTFAIANVASGQGSPLGTATDLFAELKKMQAAERAALEQRAKANGISPEEQLRREFPSTGHYGSTGSVNPNIPGASQDDVK